MKVHSEMNWGLQVSKGLVQDDPSFQSGSDVPVPLTLGVDINPDSICFHINHQYTYTYHRIPEREADGQYPFCIPQYLLLDMQLGGGWVGKVDNADLPVEMEIDWVRFYERK